MKITCLTAFKEGRDLFEKDDVRTVPDEDGARFIANGWAVAGGEPVAPADGVVTLDVQDAQMGQDANHG